MNLVVISPEQDAPREIDVLGELFSAGLERYHVRKPLWSRERLEAWLDSCPPAWRRRLVLHQHHDLAVAHGVVGRHWRDDGTARWPTHAGDLPQAPHAAGLRTNDRAHGEINWTSRSCHDLATLREALGGYDAVLLSPIFPSLSKPCHGRDGRFSSEDLSRFLANRTAAERRTSVLALGGITAETAPRALALGFEGVAVLGAIWQAADPVRAFAEIQSSLLCHAA